MVVIALPMAFLRSSPVAVTTTPVIATAVRVIVTATVTVAPAVVPGGRLWRFPGPLLDSRLGVVVGVRLPVGLLAPPPGRGDADPWDRGGGARHRAREGARRARRDGDASLDRLEPDHLHAQR